LAAPVDDPQGQRHRLKKKPEHQHRRKKIMVCQFKTQPRYASFYKPTNINESNLYTGWYFVKLIKLLWLDAVLLAAKARRRVKCGVWSVKASAIVSAVGVQIKFELKTPMLVLVFRKVGFHQQTSPKFITSSLFQLRSVGNPRNPDPKDRMLGTLGIGGTVVIQAYTEKWRSNVKATLRFTKPLIRVRHYK
jgi:hypothetical protein